jgi:hypothetical protein
MFNVIKYLKWFFLGNVYTHSKFNSEGIEIKYYMFKCSTHGFVEAYASGHKKKLKCPECMKEIKSFGLGCLPENLLN